MPVTSVLLVLSSLLNNTTSEMRKSLVYHLFSTISFIVFPEFLDISKASVKPHNLAPCVYMHTFKPSKKIGDIYILYV